METVLKAYLFGVTAPAAADAMFIGLDVKEARDISVDGEVVVGGANTFSPWGETSAGSWSLRWRDDAITNLGGFPATPKAPLGAPFGACDIDELGGSGADDVCRSGAENASADGSVIVGRSGRFALRRENGSMTPLCVGGSGGGGGSSGGGPGFGTALAVSADGSIVLSTCGTFWSTEAGDIVQLERPQGTDFSADESVVVDVNDEGVPF